MNTPWALPKKKHRILVVDNNQVIVKHLNEFLLGQGHLVESARDGLEALALLPSFRPDIVITDMMMPHISGEKLCRIIRKHPEYRDIFIIIYSGIAVEEQFDFTAFGANACIAKTPFKETRQHLTTVFEHLEQGTADSLARTILGQDKLFRRHITTELLAMVRHYEEIFNHLADGLMAFTPDQRLFFVNPAASSLLHRAEEELLLHRFSELFPAADRRRLEEALASLDRQQRVSIGEDSPLFFHDRYLALDLLQVRQPKTSFVIGVLRDITDKINSLHQMELLRKQHRQILNAAAEGICGVDGKGAIIFINPAAAQMLGRIPEACLGQCFHDLTHGLDREKTGRSCQTCRICQTIEEGHPCRGTDSFVRADGKRFPVSFTCTPIREDEKVAGGVITFSDITERLEWEARIKKAAVTDELTGLLNRRGFLAMADKLIKMADRKQRDFLLLFFDLDNMKKINDTFGHQGGDQALLLTASLLRDTFRQADVIGRLGGDEFAVLLADDIDASEKNAILGRLQENLAAINRQNRDFLLSISCGAARYRHSDPCSIDLLLSRADQAMYADKNRKKKNLQGVYTL